MKVGDYVRTKQGNIFKLTGSDIEFATELGSDGELPFDAKTITSNIIDLIEVGDIITTNNLCGEITKIDEDKIYTTCYDGEYCSVEDIKSIVTKEQFEEMEYKL